jgi:hypothetical protein
VRLLPFARCRRLDASEPPRTTPSGSFRWAGSLRGLLRGASRLAARRTRAASWRVESSGWVRRPDSWPHEPSYGWFDPSSCLHYRPASRGFAEGASFACESQRPEGSPYAAGRSVRRINSTKITTCVTSSAGTTTAGIKYVAPRSAPVVYRSPCKTALIRSRVPSMLKIQTRGIASFHSRRSASSAIRARREARRSP